MKLELMCKYVKPASKEELEYIEDELKSLSILKPDMDYEEEKERLLEEFAGYEYVPSVIDIGYIVSFNEVDGSHFTVVLDSGVILTYQGNYEKFKGVYEEMTGTRIVSFIEKTNGK